MSGHAKKVEKDENCIFCSPTESLQLNDLTTSQVKSLCKNHGKVYENKS